MKVQKVFNHRLDQLKQALHKFQEGETQNEKSKSPMGMECYTNVKIDGDRHSQMFG